MRSTGSLVSAAAASRASARLAAICFGPNPGSVICGPTAHSSRAATAWGCRVMTSRPEPGQLVVDHGRVELGEHRGGLRDRGADDHRCPTPGGNPGVVAGEDRVARTSVEVVDLPDL